MTQPRDVPIELRAMLADYAPFRNKTAASQLRSLVREEGTGRGREGWERRERGKLTVRSGEANDDVCCRRRSDWKRSRR